MLPVAAVALFRRDDDSGSEEQYTAAGGFSWSSTHGRHQYWVGGTPGNDLGDSQRCAAPVRLIQKIDRIRHCAGRNNVACWGRGVPGWIEGGHIRWPASILVGDWTHSRVGGASKSILTVIDYRRARSVWCSNKGASKPMWAQGGHVRSLRNLDLQKKQDLPKKAIDELRSFADLAYTPRASAEPTFEPGNGGRRPNRPLESTPSTPRGPRRPHQRGAKTKIDM